MLDPHVLVVDDEKNLRDFVRHNLEARGYHVKTAGTGLEALALHKTHTFDLIILDLMMPNMDGLETTRRIRQNSLVPILVLSALGEEEDKITALFLGADDYITKPFGVGELLARIRAILRRTSWVETPAKETQKLINHCGVIMDVERRTVTVNDRPVSLTSLEFDLLYHLMQNAGKVLLHRDLLQRVWGPQYHDEVEYVRVYISRLRRKLERDPSSPMILLTEHGVGYRFASE
jgi:two-component system KDP operon response regulator KdpE